MRAVLQRVTEASVMVDGEIVGRIGPGLVILVAVRNGDTAGEAEFVAAKCVNLRIFSDAAGKFNRSALEVNAELLAISQFTLYGDTRKGRRPGFTDAAPPAVSEDVYNRFVTALRDSGLRTETGRFGAMMQVALVNDGPVTVLVEKDGATT
jgi:D-tyrosyl-tRNA(Tyr) deacylase